LDTSSDAGRVAPKRQGRHGFRTHGSFKAIEIKEYALIND
jgi:hypothetical protein